MVLECEREDAGANAAAGGAESVSVVVGVDDTDDVTKETSTGAISHRIAMAAEALGGTVSLGITRHQLLLSSEVAYTSHNSAMVFEASLPRGKLVALHERAAAIIHEHRAATSNPGLCIACRPEGLRCEADFGSGAGMSACSAAECGGATGGADDAALARELMAFGRRAKVEFCSVGSAYELARRIPWVKLSEHGGDGTGVVGALAGVGLRMSGNDGRFRGKLDIAGICGREDTSRGGVAGSGGPKEKLGDEGAGAAAQARLTVGEAARLLGNALAGPVRIVGSEGADLPESMMLLLCREGKPVFSRGALTLICDVDSGWALPRSKALLGDVGSRIDVPLYACPLFERDNDEEECASAGASCGSCLHRRLLEGGFRCMAGMRDDVAHADCEAAKGATRQLGRQGRVPADVGLGGR